MGFLVRRTTEAVVVVCIGRSVVRLTDRSLESSFTKPVNIHDAVVLS